MTHLFTNSEIQIALSATKLILEMGLEKDPEFMAKYMETFDLRAECEKTLNLLENIQHWMLLAAAPRRERE